MYGGTGRLMTCLSRGTRQTSEHQRNLRIQNVNPNPLSDVYPANCRSSGILKNIELLGCMPPPNDGSLTKVCPRGTDKRKVGWLPNPRCTREVDSYLATRCSFGVAPDTEIVPSGSAHQLKETDVTKSLDVFTVLLLNVGNRPQMLKQSGNTKTMQIQCSGSGKSKTMVKKSWM